MGPRGGRTGGAAYAGGTASRRRVAYSRLCRRNGEQAATRLLASGGERGSETRKQAESDQAERGSPDLVQGMDRVQSMRERLHGAMQPDAGESGWPGWSKLTIVTATIPVEYWSNTNQGDGGTPGHPRAAAAI